VFVLKEGGLVCVKCEVGSEGSFALGARRRRTMASIFFRAERGVMVGLGRWGIYYRITTKRKILLC
jgi:hypothetical protein